MNKKEKTMSYFHEVNAKTKTRFWVNNPTLEQAKIAIENGCVGCTTNPSYISKLFNSEEDMEFVASNVDEMIISGYTNEKIASEIQRRTVARLCKLFLPIYEKSDGKEGLVTLQSNPFEEESTDCIIKDGIENRKISKNVAVKIPVTATGIEAIKYFAKNNVPTMATEVMTLSQVNSICKTYEESCKAAGHFPVFYVTHITGTLDVYFKSKISENNIEISNEALKYAGLTIAKKEYDLLNEMNFNVHMMGGGARKLEDFTQLVGGDLGVTINWKGTADELIKNNFPVASKIDERVSQEVLTEMIEKIPDFEKAYKEDALRVDEYYSYGGVELFRNSFKSGWTLLYDFIDERRKLI
jgi:transaldolase